MTVFACAGCGAVLTVPVSQVALPVHAHQVYGNGCSLGTLMEPGTFAVDPARHGPASLQGVGGAIVLAPGDVHGAVLVLGLDGFCCGQDGRDGPNLNCARCGRPVATRVDDCSLWQATWLDPNAVRRIDDAGPPRIVDWATLIGQRPGTPPVLPTGWWEPMWTAAVAASLAHLVAASGGAPITVPDGLVAATFRRALECLLPHGPGAKTLAVAGPDLPAVADMLLVPQHPQTGAAWSPPGGQVAVPIAFDVWVVLAAQRDRRPVPGPGLMPTEVHRDDPPPPEPYNFRPDGRVFLATLASLPELRQPWLRAIYDQVHANPYRNPF